MKGRERRGEEGREEKGEGSGEERRGEDGRERTTLCTPWCKFLATPLLYRLDLMTRQRRHSRRTLAASLLYSKPPTASVSQSQASLCRPLGLLSLVQIRAVLVDAVNRFPLHLIPSICPHSSIT